MSRICEMCGTHIRRLFTPTKAIARRDEATGYTYKFCSDDCANQWAIRQRKLGLRLAMGSSALR